MQYWGMTLSHPTVLRLIDKELFPLAQNLRNGALQRIND